MTTAASATDSEAAERDPCWCCGGSYPEAELVRLGRHPEVGVCLGCAHFLHQQALGREDALHRSAASGLRTALRAARRLVLRWDLHEKPVIGGLLRRLGRRLP